MRRSITSSTFASAPATTLPERAPGRLEYPGRMGGFLNWWDGVELWLSGLTFVAQTAVVMPVVLLLAYGAAILLDGALGNGIRLLRRARHLDEEGQ
jgi:hypothetical protein